MYIKYKFNFELHRSNYLASSLLNTETLAIWSRRSFGKAYMEQARLASIRGRKTAATNSLADPDGLNDYSRRSQLSLAEDASVPKVDIGDEK
jgi:hypothetical protein